MPLMKLCTGSLLTVAVLMLQKMTERATIIYSPDGVSLVAFDPDGFTMAALRIKSSSFEFFICEHTDSANVDLKHLYSKLLPPPHDFLQDYCIYIFGSLRSFTLDLLITFEENQRIIQSIPSREVELSEFSGEAVDIDGRLLQVEYQVVVAIPSAEFRRILIEELPHEADSVFITVTDKQVKLSAMDMTVVLRIELGECIIGGVEEEEQDNFTFSLKNKYFCLAASCLSTVVWILHAHDAPPMLNCPIGGIGKCGNMMYYSLC